ncbi:hypothetical protein RFI_22365 [Reticulomyxa filosa]|uniref:Amidase domain-containing protein n=1 Tax=Reticulomyxa filosa TaxID=46433 RepID=X6MNJ9_RETFI|nr:hypothetical protein RFI_22365 [Reticulomyxa filosa]|eukprot:ETO15002.1 hypothetical protein RFI_22365 [Reticulomyxa filosa]
MISSILKYRRFQELKKRGERKKKEFEEKKHACLDSKLLNLSGVELRNKILNGEYTCQQVLLTFVRQAQRCHKDFNCLLEEHYDQAFAIAVDLDNILARFSLFFLFVCFVFALCFDITVKMINKTVNTKEKRKEGKEHFEKFVDSKPLLGIPLSVKDCYIMKVCFLFLGFAYRAKKKKKK